MKSAPTTNIIAEPLRPVRILENPRRFGALKDFSCGRRGQRWEKVVNEWARETYLGTVKDPQTVVVLEDAAGKLVGACSFRPEPVYTEPLFIRVTKLIGATHRIDMIGTDRLYHGKRLADQSRPGDALLRGALDQIKAACDGHMPYAWALISQENVRSRALFERHGFCSLPYAGEGELVYVRPPHERLPIRPLGPKGKLRR